MKRRKGKSMVRQKWVGVMKLWQKGKKKRAVKLLVASYLSC